MTDPEPPRGPKRRFPLSANMPRDWLHRRDLWDLDSDAWRVYWSGVQWAIGETDGVIPYSYLGLLHPNLADAIEAAGRLIIVGLWVGEPEGYLIVDWPRFNAHPDTIAHNRWKSRRTSRTNRGDRSPNQSRTVRNGKGTEKLLTTHLREAGTNARANGHGS